MQNTHGIFQVPESSKICAAIKTNARFMMTTPIGAEQPSLARSSVVRRPCIVEMIVYQCCIGFWPRLIFTQTINKLNVLEGTGKVS